MTDGGPAFPSENVDGIGCTNHLGMSMRDYFAAQALPALIRRFGIMDGPANEVAATQAYEVADAMLAERQKATSP